MVTHCFNSWKVHLDSLEVSRHFFWLPGCYCALWRWPPPCGTITFSQAVYHHNADTGTFPSQPGGATCMHFHCNDMALFSYLCYALVYPPLGLFIHYRRSNQAAANTLPEPPTKDKKPKWGKKRLEKTKSVEWESFFRAVVVVSVDWCWLLLEFVDYTMKA